MADELCLASPPPIQLGGEISEREPDHIDCILPQARQHGTVARRQCHTCKQDLTAVGRIGLAEAWRSRVSDQGAGSAEQLADGKVDVPFTMQGKDEAERIERELHGAFAGVLVAAFSVFVSFAVLVLNYIRQAS